MRIYGLTGGIGSGKSTVAVRGGGVLPAASVSHVGVGAQLDAAGDIAGVSKLQRLPTSTRSGVGSYFPAFLPDGNLFFVSN